MTRYRFGVAAALINLASVGICVVAITSLTTASPAWWALLTAAVVAESSLFWIWPRPELLDADLAASRAKLSGDQLQLRERLEEFERVRQSLQTEIGFRADRLEERERDLATRMTRFHEFLEYPLMDVHTEKSSGQLQKLSEQDRQVRQLLETEAERVYEQIRRNAYTVNGKVDLEKIRDEGLQLIQKVARIYNPNSLNPLLETSFDQLARAASRICLHILVLLEQLPVSVQHYNANKLYSYIQKAIASYGVYQKASPWFSYLSRGLYAGRLLSASNPATLGAWWLATELGKRGAQKVIENVVDRQAIATLHDLVTVIGVEVAGIYGTGFRQRDAGWIMGTELVELIHSFPMSGESLKHGLHQITALPLRSEYDRIYLYRCLAEHRSAGLQLADPAMLTREEREGIVRFLETFFVKHIHGASASNLKKWREALEHRFDLRLNLDGIHPSRTESEQYELQAALNALAGFLQAVTGVSVTNAVEVLSQLKISARIANSDRSTVIEATCRNMAGVPFEPPPLDPGTEITHEFLRDLAICCTVTEHPSETVETLACEVSRYFRRSAQDMQNSIEAAWRTRVRKYASDPSVPDHLGNGLARAFFEVRKGQEQLAFCYGDLKRIKGDTADALPNAWLLGLELPDHSIRRAVVLDCRREPEILWEGSCPLQITRIPGIFLDDARIAGGKWLQDSIVTGVPSDLAVSGSLRGGRFQTYFKVLLQFFG